MPARLFLVRHAESTWNAEGRVQGQADPPLSELGGQQATQLAERLLEARATTLYSSPLQRAWQTADRIARATGLDVRAEDRLKEHNMGLFTGLVWIEIVQQFPDFAQAWMERAMDMPGGEKQQAFRERAAAAVGDIVARHPGERIIIVSHGGILGEYLAHGLGLDVTRRHPFRFDNASISEVEAGSSLMRIHHLNDVAHLLGTLARAHPSDDSPMGDGQLDEDRHADDDAGV